jgi:hypothetical protein
VAKNSQQTYGVTQPLVGVFPAPIIALRAPTTSDTNYQLGQVWIYTTTGQVYMLASVVAASATWSIMGPGSSDVDTITGDTGGALSPVAGNITIDGNLTQGVSTSGSGSTLTVTVASATDAQIGVAELATNAECVTGTDAVRIVTPAGLTARLAAPGAIGGTTPAAGSFTTVSASSNLSLTGAATQIRIEGGAATDFIGQATLTAGTVTVANTNIAATDKIYFVRSSINGSTALGALTYSITPATSFTITSVDPAVPANTETNDVSIVEYLIVRQL